MLPEFRLGKKVQHLLSLVKCLVHILQTVISLKNLRTPTLNHIQSYSRVANENEQEVFHIPVELWYTQA